MMGAINIYQDLASLSPVVRQMLLIHSSTVGPLHVLECALCQAVTHKMCRGELFVQQIMECTPAQSLIMLETMEMHQS